MSLASTVSRIVYPGAGLVGPFAFAFRIQAYTDLLVTRRETDGTDTTLVYGTDYSATGVGDAAGTVTLTVALAVGQSVAIRRAPPLTQTTSLRNQGAYAGSTHEDALDRTVMQLQSLNDRIRRSVSVPESYDPDAIDLELIPETGKALVWQDGLTLGNATLDSGAIAVPGSGRTVATASAFLLNNAVYNVKDFGAVGDGVTNDTAAIQAAINQAKLSKARVFFPTGQYVVTDTLLLYAGVSLIGAGTSQSTGGGDVVNDSCQIRFTPASLKDCIVLTQYNSVGTFIRLNAIEGLQLLNANSLGRYGINAGFGIYGRYEHIAIQGFQYGIYVKNSINNRFADIYLDTNTIAAVLYDGGSATTDVWDQVTFKGSPIGVKFNLVNIGIRFTQCLWEQCDNYGMEISKDCENIQVVDGYCEDVPNTANANGCMFRVGYTGTTLAVENHLTVIGGKWAGRNAGTIGNWLDTDVCNGVIVAGVDVARFVYVIRTTANTRDNSIVVMGATGITWTTGFTNTIGKVNGIYPTGAISAPNSMSGRMKDITLTNSVITPSVDLNGGQIAYPVVMNPSALKNVIDDYRECPDVGWTPTVGGSGTLGTYELAATSFCTYTKVGDMVTVFVRIVMAAALTGGGVGNIRIKNFPFPFHPTKYAGGWALASVKGIAFTGSYVFVERTSSGATSDVGISGVDNAGVETPIVIAALGVNDQILFTMTYKVSE